MIMARFYSDENFPFVAVLYLRGLRHDILLNSTKIVLNTWGLGSARPTLAMLPARIAMPQPFMRQHPPGYLTGIRAHKRCLTQV